MKNQEITNKNEWFLKLQAEAEKIGAQVYLIQKLVVDYTKSYEEAVVIDEPQPISNYDVLRLSGKYPPLENKVIDETIILLNWAKSDGSYPKAVKWGLQNGLQKTTPHVVFAIGEQFKNLNYELGDYDLVGKMRMFAIETTGCLRRGVPSACYLGWSNSVRTSHLEFQWCYGGNLGWFAFRKKIIPPLQPGGTIAGSFSEC